MAPLTVNIDMSASSTPGGNPIASYNFYCPDGLKTSLTPTSSCTFIDPGTYYLWTTVKDSKGLMDAAKTYITVLPSSGPPPPPPPPPPAPDFSMSASPGSNTVIQGASTSYSVAASPMNGFTGAVTFSVSGLPSGAGGTFNPTSVTGSGASTLTITTNSSTPAGAYPLTITGTSGSLVHTTSATLVVNAASSSGVFALAASPLSLTVARGSQVSYTVTVTSSGGFNSAVNLTVTGLPNGGSAKFSSASVVGSGTSTLTISTTKGTKAGTYFPTITGTSSPVSHNATPGVTLTVR